MKDKSPTLSIVMPFFNQKDMVEHMIDSILANDYHDWELIAIDDGSEADVADYLTQRFKNDKRIKIIPRNREPAVTWEWKWQGVNLSCSLTLMTTLQLRA